MISFTQITMKFKITLGLFFTLIVAAHAQLDTYTTQKGETLRDVAKKFKVSYRSVVKANPDISRWPKEKTKINIPDQAHFVKPKHAVDVRVKDDQSIKDNLKQLSKKGGFSTSNRPETHTVVEKETLYSLSKQYDVSLKQLVKANPALITDGLKVGQILQVPTKTLTEVPAELRPLKSNEYIVKPKDTPYQIAKTNGITVAKLMAKNPTIKLNGLKVNDTITIPSNKIEKAIISTVKTKPTKKTHEVLAGENLYRISKKHGVSVTDVMRLNGIEEVEDIKPGMVLRLPSSAIIKKDLHPLPLYKVVYTYDTLKEHQEIEDLANKYHISKDSLYSLNPNLSEVLFNGGVLKTGAKHVKTLFGHEKSMTDILVTDEPLNVLMMLPFDFKKNDSLSTKTLFSKTKSLPNYVADFYMGAKIALDSLQKQGVKLNVKLFDTEKNTGTVKKEMPALQQSEPDVIVGPFFNKVASYVADNFKDTPVYYPIYSKSQHDLSQDNIYKTAVDKKLYKQKILNYIKKNRHHEAVVIVGKESQRASLEKYKKDLAQFGLESEIKILITENKYLKQKDFINQIQLGKMNWILLANNDNVLNADVLNNMMSLPSKVKGEVTKGTLFRLFMFEASDYSKKVAYRKLADYQYTYATNEIVYDEIINNSFKKAYMAKNDAYPSDFANRGFAVTYDAIMRSLKLKTNHKEDVHAGTYRSDISFLYTKNGEKNLVNQAVYINSVQNNTDGLRIVRVE